VGGWSGLLLARRCQGEGTTTVATEADMRPREPPQSRCMAGDERAGAEAPVRGTGREILPHEVGKRRPVQELQENPQEGEIREQDIEFDQEGIARVVDVAAVDVGDGDVCNHAEAQTGTQGGQRDQSDACAPGGNERLESETEEG